MVISRQEKSGHSKSGERSDERHLEHISLRRLQTEMCNWLRLMAERPSREFERLVRSLELFSGELTVQHCRQHSRRSDKLAQRFKTLLRARTPWSTVG